MTAVVGIANGSQVWMGCDSFSGNGDYALTAERPKAFPRPVRHETGNGIVSQPILFGCTGDYRGESILRYMTLPTRSVSVEKYVEVILIDQIRQSFSEAGYLRKKDEQERQNLQIMIGYQGKLWTVWDQFEAMRHGEPYMALGSGMEFALGALRALQEKGKFVLTPPAVIGRALKAAAAHNPYVREPFCILTSTFSWHEVVSGWWDEVDEESLSDTYGSVAMFAELLKPFAFAFQNAKTPNKFFDACSSAHHALLNFYGEDKYLQMAEEWDQG